MQTGKIVTSGLVLRETDTKEADKILTVLTPELGKISVIARGARRKNSRLAASAQWLVYSEMTLYLRGNWYMLDEAGTIELFDGMRADFEKNSAGLLLCGTGRDTGDGKLSGNPAAFAQRPLCPQRAGSAQQTGQSGLYAATSGPGGL